MSHSYWEPDKMLDVYIYDYLTKRKLLNSAKAFQAESQVPTDPVAINAPNGFLLEWWSVFWDIFIARTTDKHSEAATAYLEAIKARENQQQKPPPQHQHSQMQQIFMQRQQQNQQSPSSTNTPMNQIFGDGVSQMMDPNHASLLRTTAMIGQPQGQFHGSMPANCPPTPNRSPQLPNAQEMRNEMNYKSSGPEASLAGIYGKNQGSSNLTLKGWPLTALDRLHSGHIPRPINQLQQQLLLQAQQSLSNQSVNDLEAKRLRMLLNNWSEQRTSSGFAKDGPLTSLGDVAYALPPGQVNPEMLLKVDRSLPMNMPLPSLGGVENVLTPVQVNPETLRKQQQQQLQNKKRNPVPGNDQVSNSQIGRKRKQLVTNAGPANSSGMANTACSPSSPSSQILNTSGSSKPLPTSASEGLGPTSSNQLADFRHMDDTAEVVLCQDDSDVGKGFTFSEVRVIAESSSKVECCHFSSDGKLLATGGHDKKVILWCTETFSPKATLEEHSQWITDVRFSNSASRLATSSADKTVRVWDAENPRFSVHTFSGHSTTVMSLDFHPRKDDLICSCDNTSEIRFWSIKNGSCIGVIKGGARHLRFQPVMGRIFAAAQDNCVSLLDVETQVCRLKLQGHKYNVQSVCWDSSGEYLASLSHELIRVWQVSSSGGKAELVHELGSNGAKFHTCVFHPTYPLLVIGCHESMEIWNMAGNKTMTVHAHDKLVSSLAVSKAANVIASASHDHCVKLWQ